MDDAGTEMICGVPIDLFYNLCIAIGIVAFLYAVSQIGEFFYNKYKAYKNKVYRVPFGAALLYIKIDSICSEGLFSDEIGMEPIEILVDAARNNEIKVFARSIRDKKSCIVPRKFFSRPYSLTTNGDTFDFSISHKKEILFSGLLINEDDMIKLWAPKNHFFRLPDDWASWRKKQEIGRKNGMEILTPPRDVVL